MSKSVFLKVTSAFLLGGQMAKGGEVVEVTNTEAKDLLSRGKAVLAVLDPADQLEDAIEVPEGEQVPEQPAEEAAEGQQPAAEEQPEAPAPAKGKGKKGK